MSFWNEMKTWIGGVVTARPWASGCDWATSASCAFTHPPLVWRARD
jgi:hypothetical protein